MELHQALLIAEVLSWNRGSKCPPSEVVRLFRLYHGPANRAFASLNRTGRLRLQAEMEDLWSSHL